MSLFGFAYLPALRPNQQTIPADTVPAADLRVHLYADAVARLTAAGYERIGMDHFARPDDELAAAQREGRLHRNFQGYTTLPRTCWPLACPASRTWPAATPRTKRR